MNENVVLVYANRLKPSRDAYEEIVKGYEGSRRAYIIDAPTVKEHDLSYKWVQTRLREIKDSCAPNEIIKVVLAGYSPLVALLHEVAQKMELQEVYFMRDSDSGKFTERLLGD